MAFPYDATAKYFLSLGLKDWLVLIGRPTDAEVVELDSDLSTVSAAADKLIRVNGPIPSIEHIEVESSRNPDTPIRVCRYGILAHYETRLNVNSTVFLLRPQADHAALTGVYEARSSDGTPYLQYRYQVIRLWQISAEFLLEAGIGVLPLAPLGRINREELPKLIQKMRIRVERQLPASHWDEFWTGMEVLMGLKFQPTEIQELLKGIGNMIDIRDSSVIQMFIQEGREEGREEGVAIGIERGAIQEARRMILGVIARRFGTVDPQIDARVASISDLTELEELIFRAAVVPSPEALWDLHDN